MGFKIILRRFVTSTSKSNNKKNLKASKDIKKHENFRIHVISMKTIKSKRGFLYKHRQRVEEANKLLET